jgi:hypothetical protein
MVKEPHITPDEASLIKHWRLLKMHRKGYIKISLKSNGTQFYLEPTHAEEGRVEHSVNAQDKKTL